MPPEGPRVAGALAGHAIARDFAREVMRVNHRFAAEVVGAFELCPFMSDPANAFGRFCVMLDRQPDVTSAVSEVLAAPGVVHLVYPLVTGEATPFERFGNALHEAVRREAHRRDIEPPVHATFHPEMEGERSEKRLIGFLRRSPDAFVQFVPAGLASGGTQFVADPSKIDVAALIAATQNKKGLFQRLSSTDLDAIARAQRDIRADRDKSYAPFLAALEANG
jgi:hypothetical protein